MSNEAKVDNRAGIPLNKPYNGKIEDGHFITARKPGDLPMQLFRVLERLQEK